MTSGTRQSSSWIGLGEASRLLGIAPGTLRRWADEGRIPVFTTPGGHRRFARSTLSALLPAARPGGIADLIRQGGDPGSVGGRRAGRAGPAARVIGAGHPLWRRPEAGQRWAVRAGGREERAERAAGEAAVPDGCGEDRDQAFVRPAPECARRDAQQPAGLPEADPGRGRSRVGRHSNLINPDDYFVIMHYSVRTFHPRGRPLASGSRHRRAGQPRRTRREQEIVAAWTRSIRSNRLYRSIRPEPRLCLPMDNESCAIVRAGGWDGPGAPGRIPGVGRRHTASSNRAK